MRFEKWPSIPRLSKEVEVLTEKLDGTNAAIFVEPWRIDAEVDHHLVNTVSVDGELYFFATQSRTRFITPESDNFGFAKWAYANAEGLIKVLGYGKHYGEWWGQGIQRGYGMKEKYFSLFNAPRWRELIAHDTDSTPVKGLRTVPLLFHGKYDGQELDKAVDRLLEHGSLAAPGFMRPEGVVMYLREVNASYKRLLENDDYHKWETK